MLDVATKWKVSEATNGTPMGTRWQRLTLPPSSFLVQRMRSTYFLWGEWRQQSRTSKREILHEELACDEIFKRHLIKGWSCWRRLWREGERRGSLWGKVCQFYESSQLQTSLDAWRSFITAFLTSHACFIPPWRVFC